MRMPTSMPPRRPLRDALAQPAQEGLEPLQMMTATVIAVDRSSSPWKVTLRLPDGTALLPMPFLGWWDAQVNDVTYVLRQGPSLLPIGPVAPVLTVTSPHRHAAADIDGSIIPTPPPPPVPAPPPPGPPSVRTVGVQPIGRASWRNGRWYFDDMRQGGPDFDAYWFYGNRIAEAKGAGTIVGGAVYMRRENTNHGVNGEANVRLGTHMNADAGGPATGVGTVAVQARLGKGMDANVPLSSDHVASLNGGGRGVGLAHGSGSYVSPDYLRVVADDASGALSLTIQGP